MSAVVGYCCIHYDGSTAKSIDFLYADIDDLCTRVPPSHFWRWKRDSSLFQIRRQFLKVQTVNIWHQRTHAWLCTLVKIGPTYALPDRIPRWRTLIRSAWVNILYKPRIPAAVVAAVTGRLRCWNTRIYGSWTGVVMRGLPLLGRSWADPVWLYLYQGREIVLWWATST